MEIQQSGYRYTFSSAAGDFDVISFHASEQLSQVFQLRLSLSRMNEEPVSFSDVLDNPGTLTLWQDIYGAKIPVRYFNGIISFFHQTQTGKRRTQYTAVITPTYSRTQLYSNLRIYQEKTVPDIMKIILGTDGVAPVRFDLEGEYLPREFCVQYRETDKNFIERLAAEEGIFYYFEHDKTSHTLVFTDDVGTLASLGEVYHNPNISGARTEPSLWFFEYQETVATAKYKMRDRFFEKPDYDLEQKKTGQNLDNQKTSYERYDYPGRYKEDGAGKPFTDFRLEYERRETQVATAVSDELKLIAGKHMTLSQAPTANQQTNWLIVSAIHTGTQPQSQEEDSAGGGGSTYDNRLQMIPEGLPWRAEQQPKPRVDGPQIAEISGPPGEEIYCDEYGRVKVKFLWDLEGPSDDKSSCWIRVSQYWAGTKWGGMAIPRIGQEVIVSFLEGDPDQPIVTGRTYNANNMPPYDLPANKTKMTIKSRTHKGEGFNEFRFEDEAGKEEIFIHAQLDQNNVVRNDETTDVGRDRTEHVKRNETITIDNDRLENVKHNETITIDNDRTETVKHDERITIDNDRIELVKNDETVTIKNDQHTHIKNNQYEDVDGDKHNKVKGDRLEKITGSSHLKITGSQNEEITQSVSRDTKMNVQEKMGIKYAVDAGTEVHLKAGLSAVIEATASITLQVAESVININPAGVFIDGPIVLIKSGALAVPGSGSNPDGADGAESANRAVSRDNPNTEDIEYDATIGGDNARHPLETEAAPPEIEADDAILFEIGDNKADPEADAQKTQCLTDAASNANAFVQKAPPVMPLPLGFFFDPGQQPHIEFNGNQSKKATPEEERKLIKKAHEEAKPMIDSAIESLKKAKLTKNKRVKNYFGINGTTDEDKRKLDKLILNYQSIKSGMDEIDYKVEYNHDGRLIVKGESFDKNEVAFVTGNIIKDEEGYKEFIPDDNTVHIIFPAFGASAFANVDRARTVVHELAHIKIHTVDYGYPTKYEAIETLPHEEKIRNSGSYGAYAVLSHFAP